MMLLSILVIIMSIFVLLGVFYLAKINLSLLKKNVLVLLIYIVVVCVFYIMFCKIPFVKMFVENSQIKFVNQYIVFITSCSLAVIVMSPFVAVVKKIKENKIISNFEAKYKVVNFEYYRDLVGNISPAMLSVIYNRNISLEDQIVATVIYLQEKGAVIVNSNDIYQVNNNIFLDSHEQLIINYVTNTIDRQWFKRNYYNYLKEDLEKGGYIKTLSNLEENDITLLLELVVIWIIITLLICTSALVPISSLGLFLVLSYVLAFCAIPIYQFINNVINPVARTEKALELNAKLNGLKNFLNDFTVINDRKIEEIKIFNDYILYAIVFGFKGNLDDECNQMYKKIKNNIKLQQCPLINRIYKTLDKRQIVSFSFMLLVSFLIVVLTALESLNLLIYVISFPIISIFFIILDLYTTNNKK